ncbi:hypothetical protein K030075H31_50310 [Blautia producta]
MIQAADICLEGYLKAVNICLKEQILTAFFAYNEEIQQKTGSRYAGSEAGKSVKPGTGCYAAGTGKIIGFRCGL